MIEAPYAKDLTQADSELTEREKSVVVDGFNKAQATSCLFGVVIEDTSMQPDFNIGDLVIVDADRAPKPGDYVLACLTEKQQISSRNSLSHQKSIGQVMCGISQ